jgi:hypothetical protein
VGGKFDFVDVVNHFLLRHGLGCIGCTINDVLGTINEIGNVSRISESQVI